MARPQLCLSLEQGHTNTLGHRENCRFKGRSGAVAVGSKSTSFQPSPSPKFPNAAILPSSGREVPHDGGQSQTSEGKCVSLPWDTERCTSQKLCSNAIRQAEPAVPLPLQGPVLLLGTRQHRSRNTFRKLFQQTGTKLPPRLDNTISPPLPDVPLHPCVCLQEGVAQEHLPHCQHQGWAACHMPELETEQK